MNLLLVSMGITVSARSSVRIVDAESGLVKDLAVQFNSVWL